jgi:hypothetical protein
MNLAPIAIFAFNRPDALSRLLDSLRKNQEFNLSRVYIFIDGARSQSEQRAVLEVERIAHNLRTSGGVEVVQQQLNLGLANSLIGGIEKVLQHNQSIIVLEDDLVVSEHFLSFCNSGLALYESNLKVASIQGFTHDINYSKHDTYFMLGADCWGWATWKNRWQEFEPDGAKLLHNLQTSKREKKFDLDGAYPYTRMLERQVLGLVDSWAIRWHASMFLQNRASLYPSKTLVENYGQDGSGTHIGSRTFIPRQLSAFQPVLEDIPVNETTEVNRNMRKVLRKKYGTYSFYQPMKYFNFLKRIFSDAI